MAFLAALPLYLISLRYLIVLGMWAAVSMSSPFCMAIAKAFFQLSIEYGLVLERVMPTYMGIVLYKLQFIYIPRVKYVLSWVPYVNNYVRYEP